MRGPPVIQEEYDDRARSPIRTDHSDGMIVQARHYFDMMTLLAQIGAIPGETAESAGA